MIPIIVSNQPTLPENIIPNDIEKLANEYWNSSELKKDRYSIKRANINSTVLAFENATYLYDEIPELGEKYFLLKIMQIKKMEGSENQANNIGAWFTNNLSNFVKNDGQNAILNPDGSILYITEPKDALIFAFKESSFTDKNTNFNTIINVIFYSGDLGRNGSIENANVKHIFISFEHNQNVFQRVILRPLNKLVKLFFPKINVAGGPSSAGIRIPPKGTQ